jgi:phthiodiolone/phenolphthiodiolone dimycocerosates ketoreductase
VGIEAAAAESAGWSGQFFADHLMGWFPDDLWTPEWTATAARRPSAHDYFDPVCAITSAAAATSTLRLGLGVTDLLRAHPATVARTALTLDHFTDGRFVLGLGAGEAENLRPYGISTERAVGRLEEGLEIIMALWESDGPVSLNCSSWSLDRAVLGLSPVAERTPPIWIAARGPRMRALTARFADGWLPMFLEPSEYATALADITDRRRTLGRSDRAFDAGLYAFVAIGESREECLRMFESPLYRCLGLLLPEECFHRHGLDHPLGAYGLVDFVPSLLDEQAALDLVAGVPAELVAEAVLCGSPDEVARSLAAYADAGCDHVVLANVSFLTDPRRARSSAAALDELAGASRGT